MNIKACEGFGSVNFDCQQITPIYLDNILSTVFLWGLKFKLCSGECPKKLFVMLRGEFPLLVVEKVG